MLLIAVLSFIVSETAFAFPEMIRHGYVNCTSCHVSPTGGGLLTDYGRALSKDLMSKGSFFFQKKEEPKENGEEQFLYNSVTLPDWLRMGGDARVIQIFIDNPKKTQGLFYLMQLDAEAMVTDGKRFKGVMTLGRTEAKGPEIQAWDYVLSRRHYVLVGLGTEKEPELFTARIGRFFPAYGLNLAEHTSFVRRGLGFDQELESYNAEFSYLGEDWNASFTGIFGRPDKKALRREEGASVQVAKVLGTTNKVGVNAYTGLANEDDEKMRRNLLGAFAGLGFTTELYALLELDLVHRHSLPWGFVNYTKFGYEIDQGVHLFVTQEYSKLDSALLGVGRQESYGIGTQYFPRTHWDLMVAYRKERSLPLAHYFSDVMWIMGHYYF